MYPSLFWRAHVSSLLVSLLLVLFAGCQEEEIVDRDQKEQEQDTFSASEAIELGSQLENPYSLANMRKAALSLSTNGRTNSDLDIKTTHLYVRFLPSDTLELQLLEADTLLDLYDHPLDYEIKKIGNSYHDPTISRDRPTWQYTVVLPTYNFPNIKHEILEDLFLPEALEEAIENGRTSVDYGLLYDLEDKSLRMTGNWTEPIVSENGRCRRRCWTPTGRIRVMERAGGVNLGFLPVENVRVRARNWFVTRKDYTDSRGNFVIEAFRRPVNYSVLFETPYAKVSNLIGGKTSHNGPRLRSAWNPDFQWASESWVRATLINAMAEYRTQYYRTGIQNPYPITYWAGGEAVDKLNVRAVFKEGTGDMFVTRLNRIRIYSIFTRGRGNKETDDLYRVTFHELGHQSHWRLTKGNTALSKKIV